MGNNKTRAGGMLLLLLAMLACFFSGQAKMRTDTFAFSFEGRRYSGFIDFPEQKTATALIVLVPGSGKTNIVAGNGFIDLRRRFTEAGFSCLVWDKAGCGQSQGVFDYNQTAQNSAGEVIAAITEAKARPVAGSGRIGLWGISRAGWICPLIISQYPIAFWISVSGTDDKENFGYLLEKNFLIEGRSKSQTEQLMREWRNGIKIARTGGTFMDNLKATATIRNDSFYRYISNNSAPTEEGYLKWQKTFQTGENMVDTATELVIYVPHFEELLKQVNCPVLAIFGEKDAQVDWQKTKALYMKAIGKRRDASLVVKVLPDCNHNMLKCKTGGYREELARYEPCTGYYDAMLAWLKEKGFGH